MANQVTVSNNNTINVTVEPPANVQVQVSRAVIGTVANVASANLANYVTQPNQSNITSVGIMTGLTSTGNITAPFFIGNVVGNISGNLVVPGSNTAVLFNNQGNAGASDALKFNYSSNVLTANGNIVANYFIGNGSQLTDVIAVSANYANYANIANTANSIAGANVTGYVANASHSNVADLANSVAVANVVGIGNIAVINLDGNASNILYGNGVFGPDIGPQDVANANYANFAGDVVNSSQPNITSLGTLTGLVMGGNITPNANITYNLGNNTNRFKDLYLSGTTIYLGDQTISANATSISFTGNLTGNATGLSNIVGANVTGYVANATHSNVADLANSIAGANVTGQVNYAAVANSVAGANVSGAVNLATYATTANSVAGANVSGAVNLATYATTANAVAGANVSGQVGYAATANSVALANVVGIGNIASINLDGNVSNLLTGAGTFVAIPTGGGNAANANYANYAGNVVNSSQPNITSVGTLTSLDVSGNATIGNITNVDSITFDTANVGPGAVAQLTWDDGQGTLDLGLKGGNVTAKLAEQEYARVYNAEANSLSKGEIVYVSGAQGNLIKVNRALANTEATSSGTLGMVAETITAGGEGFVQTSGAIYKLNTNTLTAGNAIYLSPTTAGAYTQTKPVAPDQLVILGWVERVSTTVGSIYLKVDNGYELDELHNVLITSPTAGQALVYNGSNIWINGNPNIANIANTVSNNAQPNITSTGNLISLNVRDNSNANSVIQQFVPNSTPIWTNNPTSNSAYQVTTQYWPNASTNYPTRSIIRSRGNATTPTTAVTSDRVAQDRLLVYNGNANVLIGTETWTLTAGGTLSSLANQAYTGGQWNILTGNPAASNLANSNATDTQNQLVFTNSGAIAIVRSTPANSSLSQTTNMISTTDYGSNVNNLTQAGGILQQRIRGNRDGNLSVQPSDVIGRMLYAGYNGTSVDTTNAATITAYVDSSYTANNSIIPINISLNALSNVGGVATFKTTQFYGNGTTSFPGLITTTGNANVANLNVTGNVLPTSNITYDLGSNTYRFKDIWLANSTIHIGDQTISANATNTIISGIITGDGSGLTNLPIATNLVVGTRTTPVTIPISNYEMNVLTRTGNVVVYVN